MEGFYLYSVFSCVDVNEADGIRGKREREEKERE